MRLFRAVSAILCLSALTGCNADLQQQNTALLQQNAQLATEVAQCQNGHEVLQATIAQCQGSHDSLQARLMQCAGENENLQARNDQAVSILVQAGTRIRELTAQLNAVNAQL